MHQFKRVKFMTYKIKIIQIINLFIICYNSNNHRFINTILLTTSTINQSVLRIK